MVYYVVYRASKNYSNRSLIPARLRAIGSRRINETLWEFDNQKIAKVLRLLEKNQPMVLKKTKEVRKRLIVKGGIQDLGSLIVVAFKAPKDKKEKIRNFLKKAPCIRLCRCVYAFYQRHPQLDPENRLIDAQRLAAFIKELDGEVKLIPNLVILNEHLAQRLVDETNRKVENAVLDMLQNCMQLYNKSLSNDCNHTQFNHALGKIRRQFVIVKKKAMYYQKWMGLDFSKNLMKNYRALIKVKHASIGRLLAT